MGSVGHLCCPTLLAAGQGEVETAERRRLDRLKSHISSLTKRSLKKKNKRNIIQFKRRRRSQGRISSMMLDSLQPATLLPSSIKLRLTMSSAVRCQAKTALTAFWSALPAASSSCRPSSVFELMRPALRHRPFRCYDAPSKTVTSLTSSLWLILTTQRFSWAASNER